MKQVFIQHTILARRTIIFFKLLTLILIENFYFILCLSNIFNFSHTVLFYIVAVQIEFSFKRLININYVQLELENS